MNDREKLLWIDACRSDEPAAGDSASRSLARAMDAEARELFERVRECDAAVRRAMDDVPLPQGLSSRILASLEAARSNAPESAPASAQPADAPVLLPLPPQPILSRRRWMWRSAAAALLASGGLAMHAYLNRPAGELSNEDLWGEFLARFEGQASQAASAQPLASAPRRSFPVCELNAGVAVRGWHDVEALQRAGVCYYLRSAGGQSALLWVLPLEGNPPVAPNLATAALQSSRNTAGLAVTAWKSRGVVYVLVAQGETLTPFVGRSGLT